MIMICFILFDSLGSNIAWFILFAYDKLNVGVLLCTDQRFRTYLHIKPCWSCFRLVLNKENHTLKE